MSFFQCLSKITSWFRGFLIILPIIFTSSFALAQVNYYYYGGGEQRALFLSPKKVAVKFIPTLTQQEIENFVTTDSSLDPTISPEPILNKFHILNVLPENNIETLILRLRAKVEIVLANPVYLTPDSFELIATDEFVVKFYPEATRAEIDSLNSHYGVVVDKSILGLCNVYVLKLTGFINKDVLVTSNQYYQDPRTIYAHPNFFAELRLHSLPSDSFFVYQWNYHNLGQTGGRFDADIDAPLAWDVSMGDFSVKIAVIGQGVETHEDFPPDLFAGGIDLVGEDVYNPQTDWDASPGDSCAHEQACAGLIAGAHSVIGVAGLAPECKLVVIKFGEDDSQSPCFYQGYNQCCQLSGDETIIADAFYWAASYRANIASCSWAFPCYYYSDIIADAINEFVQPSWNNPTGRVVVFSAGNNRNKYGQGCVEFPANLPTVLAVGATDSLDNVAWYSSPGPELDLVAPSGNRGRGSGNIYTADLMGLRGDNPTYVYPPTPANINYYGAFGGTSAAAPQVAASCALILSQYKLLYPQDTLYGTQVMNIVCKSAEDSSYIFGGINDDTVWKGENYGYGRLNAFRALLAISRGDVNNDKSITISDVNYLIAYLMQGGPAPVPVRDMADANCDGKPSIGDVVWLINYLFKGGPKPLICYKYPNNY